MFEDMKGPIGIFDSGYGGLTVLKEIISLLPQYDYIYLGDNARAPYGIRSFEIIHSFTREAVQYLFSQGCPLIILACNTASAKALRAIQQIDLPKISNSNRVLGVIRPTVEVLGKISKSGHIGILGTPSTIASHTYSIEIGKMYPSFKAYGQACPLFVPLVENGEYTNSGADYFVKKYLDQLFKRSDDIDTIILGCTHYPLLMEKIQKYVPSGINILAQGEIVATSLVSYLDRHTEIENRLSKRGNISFLTTETVDKFNEMVKIFINKEVYSNQIKLG